MRHSICFRGGSRSSLQPTHPKLQSEDSATQHSAALVTLRGCAQSAGLPERHLIREVRPHEHGDRVVELLEDHLRVKQPCTKQNLKQRTVILLYASKIRTRAPVAEARSENNKAIRATIPKLIKPHHKKEAQTYTLSGTPCP